MKANSTDSNSFVAKEEVEANRIAVSVSKTVSLGLVHCVPQPVVVRHYHIHVCMY